MIPDTRTPMQVRGDAVGGAIAALLADPKERNDIDAWTELLAMRHDLPEAERRGFDARLRAELIAFVNDHAKSQGSPTGYKSFIMDLPLRKTVSGAIFTEMEWWDPEPPTNAAEAERVGQLDWLEAQLQNGLLRPGGPKPRKRPTKPPRTNVDASEPAEPDGHAFIVLFVIFIVLITVVLGD